MQMVRGMQYPPDFCAALAEMFRSQLADSMQGEPLPHEFLEKVDSFLQSFDHDAAMGPDFHAPAR